MDENEERSARRDGDVENRSAQEGVEERPAQGYIVPTYVAAEDTVWYHFLHGNVPGHQIDFMYRPDVPQGSLTRQHFSHLSRLMKYIEPQTNNDHAFAIANLSRDDTQHEAGHGGLGMIFGLRIHGVTDHAGRQDPPFAHGIAAIDREMDYATLLSTALSFHQHMFGRSGYDSPSSMMYRSYVRHAAKGSGELPYVLKAYTSEFGDLPKPPTSPLGLQWITGGALHPKRIVIVHPDEASFGDIAECASRVAAVLYQSDIRWTAITTGRESDVPGGVTVRFVAQRDAPLNDSRGDAIFIDEVPEHPGEIARKLFGAKGAGLIAMESTSPVGGWRDRIRQVEGYAPLPPSPHAPKSDRVNRGALPPDSSRPRYSPRREPNPSEAELPGEFQQSSRMNPREARAAIGGISAPSTEASPTETMTLEPGEIEFVDEDEPTVSKGATSTAPVISSSVKVSETPRTPEAAASGPVKRHDQLAATPRAQVLHESKLEADHELLDGTVTGERPARSGIWVWVALIAVCAVIVPVAFLAMTRGSQERSSGEINSPPSDSSSVTVASAPTPFPAVSVSSPAPSSSGTPSNVASPATTTWSGSRRPNKGTNSNKQQGSKTMFERPVTSDELKPKTTP